MTGIDIDLDAHPGAQRRQILIARVDTTRIGMRCTTFTQLPLVFSAGRSENSSAAAGLMLATVPRQFVSG
jgi:hypothetical protein